MILVEPQEFARTLFSTNLVKYATSFDPLAPLKLQSLPLPDAIGGGGKDKDEEKDSASSARRKSQLRTRSERRSTLTKAVDAAAASTGEEKSASPVKKSAKDASNLMLTAPKILRLRPRFGLEPRPEEILFLERGPSFQDPASMKSSDREMDTLLAEKAGQDEQRSNEKARLRDAATISAAATNGIGVLRKVALEKLLQDGKLSHSSSRSSLRASLTASSSTQSLLSAAAAIAAAGAGPTQSTATDQTTPRRSSQNSALSPNALLSPASVASPSGVLSPGAPDTPSSNIVVADATPRYKSLFFSSPEIHTETATFEPTAPPPGSAAKPTNTAFKRRFARRSQDPSNPLLESQASVISPTAPSPPSTSAPQSTHKRVPSKSKLAPSGSRSALTEDVDSTEQQPKLVLTVLPMTPAQPARTVLATNGDEAEALERNELAV